MTVSRLLHSRSCLPRLFSGTTISRKGRLLSTGFNKIDDQLKTDEAGTFDTKRPPTGKLLVLGGNGFVGSHICREALEQGLTVSSLSRSGRPSLHDSWVNDVLWHKGDLLSPGSLKQAMSEATSVISCVGAVGSNPYMYRINGTANVNAIRAAVEQRVKRFVYVSAADFGLLYYLLRGYYEGKRVTEAELNDKFPDGAGIILRPGFIHGTRQVGNMKLPLGAIGAPLQMVLQHAKFLTRIPLIGPLFIPPVKVTSVAKVAVRAAIDPLFPSGIVDVYGILQHGQHKSA
ncbi:uncharacterized protein At1g32220, chloroplastic isoform X1 [Herrania umbratica]|uniref:Uncharacterized protein At1g32220, chloroplastic isoform X1 n=1 Tax=Herrania umbratica TaxID=108875 RepID=A0A6J1AV12_9ROSI|nr:uncharacterized protein At1g32220, chloroplastic isoform X1 [Herrania umbratica]